MSTAGRVPETWELDGDDARETLKRIGVRKLLRDAFMRLRFADGFSHARSLAFATSLVLVQGLIAIVGFAAVLNDDSIARSLVRTIRSAVPGPASRVLTDAVIQAYNTGASSRWLPLVLGTVGALITGSTLFGQFERGLNRIYGVEQDRPSVQKYGLAFLLTVTAGACAATAFVVFAFGREIGTSIGSEARTVWDIARWPIALVLIGAAMALLFRLSPYRRQPAWSWLAYGSALSVVLWSAVHARAGRDVRSQLDVRRHVRPARGHRRAPDLDAPLCDQHPLRSCGCRAARGSTGGPARGPGSGQGRRRSREARHRQAGLDVLASAHCHTVAMEYGAHLPLDGPRRQSVHPRSSRDVHEGRRRARLRRAGGQRPSRVLAARGSTARPRSPRCWSTPGSMTLATTVALVVIRGPVALAKTLGAIDRLSGGRLVAAVGPALPRRTTPRWVSSSRTAGDASTRRSRPCARCGNRGTAVRGDLLHDRGDHVGAAARAARRSTDLDRELGIRRRASSRGAAG